MPAITAPSESVTYTYGVPGSPRPHFVTSTTDGRTFTPDANGNMISDGTKTITYDYDNMPTSVTMNGETTSFVYDGAGARAEKTNSYGTTVYIGKLYECREDICTKYIFVNGKRIAANTYGNIIYYHQDHLGSTRVVTNDVGENQETVYYYPFGATQSDIGAVSVDHKYTQQEFDAETGLYYYNARYYDPVLGRFISPDTIVPNARNPQMLNRYSYVGNNPLAYNDPDGHYWHIVVGAVVGAVVAGSQSDWDVGAMLKGAVIGAVSAAVGGAAGTWAYGTAGGSAAGASSAYAAGVVGGAAGGATGGAMSTAFYGGNLGENMLAGAGAGAIGGGVGALAGYGLSSAGANGYVSAGAGGAAGGYAGGYVSCGSGCARRDAWAGFASAVIMQRIEMANKQDNRANEKTANIDTAYDKEIKAYLTWKKNQEQIQLQVAANWGKVGTGALQTVVGVGDIGLGISATTLAGTINVGAGVYVGVVVGVPAIGVGAFEIYHGVHLISEGFYETPTAVPPETVKCH